MTDVLVRPQSGWVEEPAPAKVNLTLHVTGQRDDGYHLLDSLVIFPKVYDRVRLRLSDKTTLKVTGPKSDGVPNDASNLVWQAADLMGLNADIELFKNLPTAAGIGGGSADAAATLRALAHVSGKPLPGADVTATLGADVPVCVAGHNCRMSAIGDVIERVANLPDFHIVLVNPGQDVSTPAVFRLLETKTNAPMPDKLPKWRNVAELALWLSEQRNDLEGPASVLCPTITDCVSALAGLDGCLLARMSGSGATCFGIFSDPVSADRAGEALQKARPHWWVACAAVSS